MLYNHYDEKVLKGGYTIGRVIFVKQFYVYVLKGKLKKELQQTS